MTEVTPEFMAICKAIRQYSESNGTHPYNTVCDLMDIFAPEDVLVHAEAIEDFVAGMLGQKH